MEHPLFEIVTTTTGAISIRHKIVNEIMHNPVGPWVEANALYIQQSGLAERLRSVSSEPLVLFDVGLGAASNAIAALSCHRSCGVPVRPLKLISFEREMELPWFTLEHADEFHHVMEYREALRDLLEKGRWSSIGVTWELRRGNFLDHLETEKEKPHLIYFDPYSPKVNQEMWTASCFQKLRRLCRESSEGGTSLFTYSQATRIRAALLAADFFVGYGDSTGLKEQTTQASTDFGQLKKPLDEVWFRRWERSHQRYPFDCPVEGQADLDQIIKRARLQYLPTNESENCASN